MIHVNKHNYQEWMGAYLNGGLNKADMLSVDLFLQQNPDILNVYLEELEDLTIQASEVQFNQKVELSMHVVPFGSIHQNNFTEYFINCVEGNLNHEQKTELENFLEHNPKLQPEFNVYQAAILKSDLTIQYPAKKDLLKKQRPAVPLFWSISAAASILVLVGAWLLWPGTHKNGVLVKEVASIYFVKKGVDTLPQVPEQHMEIYNHTTIHQQTDTHTIYQPLANNLVREKNLPVLPVENLTVHLPQEITSHPLALKHVPWVDVKELDDNGAVANSHSTKKGLFDKIFSGEQTYIEDYVNAAFHTFKGKRKGPDKWVLKVERDANGKSKKIKFTSPIFSAKIEN